MDIAKTFAPLLQIFTGVMTQPTAATFSTLLAGWLVAPRRTEIGMVRSSGTERHHAAFHRAFASARWSIDHLTRASTRWKAEWCRPVPEPRTMPIIVRRGASSQPAVSVRKLVAVGLVVVLVKTLRNGANVWDRHMGATLSP